MKRKRKDKESYPQWIQRLLPELTDKQHKLIVEMIKEVWFDGLDFERKRNGTYKIKI